MADSTRRVSVRLSLDDAARVKQELRDVGVTGQSSLERITGGADRASRPLDLLDVAIRDTQIAILAATQDIRCQLRILETACDQPVADTYSCACNSQVRPTFPDPRHVAAPGAVTTRFLPETIITNFMENKVAARHP